MTRLMREALSRDVLGQYSEAIKHYELELSRNHIAPVDAYLNLAFIYGELASQPPFTFDEGISDKWSGVGRERYRLILEMGLSKFPDNLELHFWEKYFPYRLQIAEFTRIQCEQLFRDFPNEPSLVPYFFLYLFDKERYSEKIDELLKECKNLLTAKNRYIISIINRKR